VRYTDARIMNSGEEVNADDGATPMSYDDNLASVSY